MSKQMQRFGLRWVKRPAAVALLLLIGMAGEAATFVAYTNVAYEGSSTDAIADMWPVNLYYNHGGQAAFHIQLADGDPSNLKFDLYPPVSTFIYAYGSPGDTNEYVSRFDGWVYAGEGARNDFDFEIGFSSDGVTFTNLIRGNNGNTLAFANAFNLGRFFFEPGETRGMGYIRIISTMPLSWTPRIAEIDVFTERVSPDAGPKPYTLTFDRGIPLNQSPTDAINGKSAVFSRSYTPTQSGLNDAVGATNPCVEVIALANAVPVTNIWDLGCLRDGTYLDRVDVWFPRLDDGARTPLRAGVIVSSDTASWRYVADTGGRACTNAPNNLVRIQFRRSAVENFRYIGIIDYPCANSTGNHGRFVEVDVFTDAPRGTVWMVR